MNRIAPRFVRFCFALLGLVILGWVLTGQAAKPVHQRFPLVTDWSHRHVIFSRPATAEQARLVGNEPRYWQQLERLRQRTLLRTEQPEASLASLPGAPGGLARRRRMHRDWSVNLGSGGSVGAGNYPMKFSFDNNVASCANDFVVFSTGLTGSLTQASIVAFNNLYSGCLTGTVPSVYWAYDTSQIAPPDPGAIKTSPVFSRDGTQIAFVQTNGVGAATLVLLKWQASAVQSVTAPGLPAQVAAAVYPACPAIPCMTKFDLRSRGNTVTDDTTSSIFYDYTGDTAWVGDSQGLLHKFNPVFNGVPAEIRDVTWPVPVSGPLPLSSPAFDRITGNVFAGGGDGLLYRVHSGTGAVVASGQLDFGTGIVAGPVLDVTGGRVYVSASNDNSTDCGSAACAALYVLATNFAAAAPGAKVQVGTSSATPNPMYNGYFDNTYFNSGNATGHFYVCGNTGLEPSLYQIPIQAGVPGTPIVLATLSTDGTSPACSPVLDILNPNSSGGPTERAFVSVQNNGRAVPCAGGGCILDFVTTPWQPSTAYTVGQEILVPTLINPTGLIIDVVTAAGTSDATPPVAWPVTPGLETVNGSATFLTQGHIIAGSLPTWLPNVALALHFRIVDNLGNVQVVQTAGTTGGGSAPAWNTTPGGTTAEGPDTLVWVNAGALPVAALPAAGGTSGIIIDNVVGSGTLPGASQVYFSTLADQVCASGGSGGCAVQASQPALQ
jgi:hypothetical protein